MTARHCLPGLVLAALGVTAAAAVPAVTLPPPGGNPMHIDVGADPLVGFARSASPAAPFLERLGTAIEKHPAVAAAIAEAQASEGVRTEVRAGLFPHIDAQLIGVRALARDFGDRTAIVESLQPRSRSDAQLSGNQLLYDFGATGNRISAANERIAAARAEVGRVAGDTALRAVTAWYQLLGYQTLVELSDASISRQRDILRDVRTRFTQGIGAAGDVARAEAVLADTVAQEARFARSRARAREQYREAFGDDPPPTLSRPLAPRSQAQSRDAAEALSNASPLVIAALKRAEAARRDYRASKADGLPRLSAGVNGTRYDVFSGSDYEVRGTIVLRQSLFAGGEQRGRIAQARAASSQAAASADQVMAEGERDAGIAFSDVTTLTETATALEAAYIANRRVRDGYVEQFRVSRGTLIELLRAEQDYFAAASGYLQGIIELDIARFTLLARTGEILPVAGVDLKMSAL